MPFYFQLKEKNLLPPPWLRKVIFYSIV